MAAPGWLQGVQGGRLAKIAGRILMLVALAFIGREVHRHWADLSAWTPRPAQLVTVAALAIAYGLALFLLVENWHRIVALFAPEPRVRTYPSYTMTQIAKYLPGNIVHLLGRAAWLRGGGLTNRQLGQATLLEMAVVPAGAALFLLLACLVVPLADLVPALAWAQPLVVPLAVAVVLAALAGLLLPWPGRLRRPVPALVAASLTAMLFMAVLGASFALVLNRLAPAGAPLAALPFAAAIAVLGWLTGYLTPGAPGGLGTREAVMLVLLAGSVGQSEALIAITLFRLVTVLGDLVCFAVGWRLFPGTASRDPGAPAA